MCSSLTLLSAEIEGRAYGGGVLKLETKEAERVQVPLLSAQLVERLLVEFDRINALRTGGDLEGAASIVDDLLGLDHPRLWSAYLTFRGRRLGRRRAPRPSTMKIVIHWQPELPTLGSSLLRRRRPAHILRRC